MKKKQKKKQYTIFKVYSKQSISLHLQCCFRECRIISMKQIQNIGQKVAEAMCLNIKSVCFIVIS